jgi:hypothetical protein
MLNLLTLSVPHKGADDGDQDGDCAGCVFPGAISG